MPTETLPIVSWQALMGIFQQADAFPGWWDVGYAINDQHMPVFDGTIRCQDAQMRQSVVVNDIPLDQEAAAERICQVVNVSHQLAR